MNREETAVNQDERIRYEVMLDRHDQALQLTAKVLDKLTEITDRHDKEIAEQRGEYTVLTRLMWGTVGILLAALVSNVLFFLTYMEKAK
ncbi:MAG TPA: hypothetical protein PK916_04675 [Bacteroidota bacterium]|nr:hypothetical protein [Bacteroidota bacterium]